MALNLRAKFDADTAIVVHGQFRSESFSSIEAGVGWPNSQPGAVVALGRRLDGGYHILEEKRGQLFEITRLAREMAGRLLVNAFWVDSSDSVSLTCFRGEDGPLAPARPPGRSGRQGVSLLRLGRKESWTSDCGVEDKPVVRSASDSILKHFRSSLERVRGMIELEKALINEKLCPSIMYAMRQPVEYALESPVMVALAIGLLSMADTGGEDPALDGRRQWYGNMNRAK